MGKGGYARANNWAATIHPQVECCLGRSGIGEYWARDGQNG
jgi:hypothetical protein